MAKAKFYPKEVDTIIGLFTILIASHGHSARADIQPPSGGSNLAFGAVVKSSLLLDFYCRAFSFVESEIDIYE